MKKPTPSISLPLPCRRSLHRLALGYEATAKRDAGFVVRSSEARIDAVAGYVVRVAYHEAAHAVVGVCIGEEPIRLSIEPGAETPIARWGECDFKGADLTNNAVAWLLAATGEREDAAFLRWHAESVSLRYLAGDVCESLVGQQGIPLEYLEPEEKGGMSEDLLKVVRLFAAFDSDPKRIIPWCRRLAKRTFELITQPEVWSCIGLVAERLLDEPTLGERELAPLQAGIIAALPAGGGAGRLSWLRPPPLPSKKMRSALKRIDASAPYFARSRGVTE